MKFRNVYITLLLFSTCFLYSQTKLPAVTVNNSNGESLDIGKYVETGGPKIISLWATWCGPCRMELNALKKVYPKWQEMYNLEIIAISVDIPPMIKRAKKMFDKNGWEYTFLHDSDQELMAMLGIQGIPYSMLLDDQGVIQSVQVGYYPGYEKELERKIKKL